MNNIPTKKELLTMDGVKVRAITQNDKTIEGEICVEGGSVYILHNNSESEGGIPKNMRGYDFGWSLTLLHRHEDFITYEITSLEILEDKSVQKETKPAEQTKEYKEWDIYPEWESLTPLPSNKNAKELGYKEGDLFVNVSSDTLKEGEVVRLERDDGTSSPWFKLGCEYLRDLAPLPNNTPPQTPEKENIKHTYELQYVRSDGVIFTNDTIGGKKIEDLNREKTEALAMVREINALLQAHKAKF